LQVEEPYWVTLLNAKGLHYEAEIVFFYLLNS
jgi:hypothetical protein